MQGKVSVQKKEIKNDQSPEFKDPALKIDNSPRKLRKIKTLNNENIEYEIKILEKGTSFGELALLENKPRAATVACKENCHFATLERQYFDQILSILIKFMTYLKGN